RVPEQRMTSTYERRCQPPAPMLEVSGTAAETDCEMERARELMSSSKGRRGSREATHPDGDHPRQCGRNRDGCFGLAAGGAVASNVASIVGGALGGGCIRRRSLALLMCVLFVIPWFVLPRLRRLQQWMSR
ncbi:MAG: hypothetical protein M3Z35_05945, partial [Nitrospirota bacterium]|nr:hypothetical protein [Nitrospirota bacterium]